MEHVYDPAADRFDVAIRTVVKLALGKIQIRGVKNWAVLEKLGLNRREHASAIEEASYLVESLHTDAGIACLLHECPFVLGAALELLREYLVVTSESRASYYNTGTSITKEKLA